MSTSSKVRKCQRVHSDSGSNGSAASKASAIVSSTVKVGKKVARNVVAFLSPKKNTHTGTKMSHLAKLPTLFMFRPVCMLLRELQPISSRGNWLADQARKQISCATCDDPEDPDARFQLCEGSLPASKKSSVYAVRFFPQGISEYFFFDICLFGHLGVGECISTEAVNTSSQVECMREMDGARGGLHDQVSTEAAALGASEVCWGAEGRDAGCRPCVGLCGWACVWACAALSERTKGEDGEGIESPSGRGRCNSCPGLHHPAPNAGEEGGRSEGVTRWGHACLRRLVRLARKEGGERARRGDTKEPPELEPPVELTWRSRVVELRSGECNARASSGSRSGEVGGNLRQSAPGCGEHQTGVLILGHWSRGRDNQESTALRVCVLAPQLLRHAFGVLACRDGDDWTQLILDNWLHMWLKSPQATWLQENGTVGPGEQLLFVYGLLPLYWFAQVAFWQNS
ncbi:hypothetical protein DFH08DRAFT_798829 [Mycena albidolilacea]|uniref:Uncharacterized protein n=1 Tax=Mycena albidolilacea TaxID=1033008 RepID=A0AAD7F455_9AGAR|nr:hypothetical protein DFH08DRAFT_798829 [Mycena albidolilacea]